MDGNHTLSSVILKCSTRGHLEYLTKIYSDLFSLDNRSIGCNMMELKKKTILFSNYVYIHTSYKHKRIVDTRARASQYGRFSVSNKLIIMNNLARVLFANLIALHIDLFPYALIHMQNAIDCTTVNYIQIHITLYVSICLPIHTRGSGNRLKTKQKKSTDAKSKKKKEKEKSLNIPGGTVSSVQ